MPSRIVDLAWHEFICHTRHYGDSCADVAGRSRHHIPESAMTAEQRKFNQTSGMARSWHLACLGEGLRHLGDGTPLLFWSGRRTWPAGCGQVLRNVRRSRRLRGGTGRRVCPAPVADACADPCAGRLATSRPSASLDDCVFGFGGATASGPDGESGGGGGCGGGGCGGGSTLPDFCRLRVMRRCNSDASRAADSFLTWSRSTRSSERSAKRRLR
jgi:hypothetical protein